MRHAFCGAALNKNGSCLGIADELSDSFLMKLIPQRSFKCLGSDNIFFQANWNSFPQILQEIIDVG